MAEKVTKRQQAVLDCIEECIRGEGIRPDRARGLPEPRPLLPLTVHVHLKALEEKGLIERHRASGDYRAVSVSLTEEVSLSTPSQLYFGKGFFLVLRRKFCILQATAAVKKAGTG